MMKDSAGRLVPAIVIIASTVIGACGSGSPSGSGSNSSQSQPQQELLSFARCMRSHGVSNFPDPNPNGSGFNINVAGMNSSSPAFTAAQTACKRLLPGKRSVPGASGGEDWERVTAGVGGEEFAEIGE